MVTQKEKVTLGVRVDRGIVHQMDQIYKKFYVDKSKQIRCLLNYFLSLPENEQKQIIDRGMQSELSSVNGSELSLEVRFRRHPTVFSPASADS